MRKVFLKVLEMLAYLFTKPISWPGALLVIFILLIVIALIMPSCAST